MKNICNFTSHSYKDCGNKSIYTEEYLLKDCIFDNIKVVCSSIHGYGLRAKRDIA